MRFEWFVALRYLREGRMQTLLILSGVAVGIGVIIFLAALIDGLQVSLVQKTLGSQAHITISPPEEMPRVLVPENHDGVAARIQKPAQRLRSINQWPVVEAQIRRGSGIVATSPTATGAAFASRGAASKSILMRGIDPVRFDRIVDVSGRLVRGRFGVAGGEAVIGTELASDLGATVGDKIRIVVPDGAGAGAGDGGATTGGDGGRSGIGETGRTAGASGASGGAAGTAAGAGSVFTITGVFDLQNKDVNARWVLVSLKSAQSLLSLQGGVTAIEIKVAHVFEAESIARRISARTGLQAESWMIQNAQLLTGLRSQNSSRYMIQTFVVIAVALGIASVLVVWVVQKNREIGILRAVGTSRVRILRVFLIQGALLGFGGWAAGALVGTALSIFFSSMARNADGSPTFPMALNPRLFAGTAVLAILTGLLAAVWPARRAAALDPATVIYRG